VSAAPAPAREQVASRDRSATRGYLEAELAYQRALTAAAPAAKAGVEAVANGLIRECPGVLTGAPRESLKTIFENHPQTPRQTGESNRAHRQLADVQLELTSALALPGIDAGRQAGIAYARAIRMLRWSNTTLTTLEHDRAEFLEWQLQVAAPRVCADMKAWRASGYKTLSSATKTYVREAEARVDPLLLLERELRPARSAAKLLARYEGPTEKALSRKIDALERGREASAQGVAGLFARVDSALGLVTEAEAHEATESHEGPPKGATVLAEGRSAAGGRYTIWLEPKQQRTGRKGTLCRLTLAVAETQSASKVEGGEKSVELTTGFGGTEACLSRAHPERASVQCEEGLLTIAAQTLPRTRRVRLLLSDGREVTSNVALVPARRGGPLGFYYQVVRGPKPVPVSFAELDRHGKVLRTVKLPRSKRCVAHPFRYLPGGFRTIVNATVPQGPSYSIIGERVSFGGHVQSAVRLELGLDAESQGITNETGSIVERVEGPRARPKPFELQVKTGCTPHEYAVLYGVLRDRRDSVVAQTVDARTPLRRAAIPSSLHIPGVLAYAAFPSMPSELVVRNPKGRLVMTRHLAGLARRSREVCEGEAEPPA
jgi:hypothetical protein